MPSLELLCSRHARDALFGKSSHNGPARQDPTARPVVFRRVVAETSAVNWMICCADPRIDLAAFRPTKACLLGDLQWGCTADRARGRRQFVGASRPSYRSSPSAAVCPDAKFER